MNCNLYFSAIGWMLIDYRVVNRFAVDQKYYEIIEDVVTCERYWVIIGQDIHEGITYNQEVIESILKYSQKSNWVVECFRLTPNIAVTRYYPEYYPVIPSFNCMQLHGDVLDTRKNIHSMHFNTDMRKAFHREAIRQHELFSDATGCYFSDIQPNNFLADKNFGDPKIIDVCSIVPGNIKTDYKDPFEGCPDVWPVPDSRTVGRHP